MAEEQKKLFDQSLKDTVSESDRFAVGIPGAEGCDNLLFPKVRSSMFKGETGKVLTTGVNNITFAIAFPSVSYVIFVNDHNGIAYEITNKAAGGFDIEPLASTTIDYICILL